MSFQMPPGGILRGYCEDIVIILILVKHVCLWCNLIVARQTGWNGIRLKELVMTGGIDDEAGLQARKETIETRSPYEMPTPDVCLFLFGFKGRDDV